MGSGETLLHVFVAIVYASTNPVLASGPTFPKLKSGQFTAAWTNITYLLYKHGISWKYYVGPNTPLNWNVLPYSTNVRHDGQLSGLQAVSHFYADATGQLAHPAAAR